MTATRLDILLVSRGLATTRSKAQALIKAGVVRVGSKIVTKPGTEIADHETIEVTGTDHPWISRGGMKLAHALQQFCLEVKGFSVIDVGASTGGFTDVLLHHGAAKVYAVDVGTDQLAPRLRQDERVVSLEQTNARDLNQDHIPQLVDLVVCDASFISLSKVLPAALARTKPNAQLVALIKPQFEVGKAAADEGRGVIRDAALHMKVCDDVAHWLTSIGWSVLAITTSPIEGPKGNIEFLLHAGKG